MFKVIILSTAVAFLLVVESETCNLGNVCDYC